ncbi:MAG: SseB family protein [Pseudomonadota bacterium]
MNQPTTPLDEAWMATEAPGAGDAETARFYDLFAATELHMPVEPASLDGGGAGGATGGGTGGGAPQPLLFPIDGGDAALVFDREDRMTAFMEGGAAHLTLSGRAAIQMFAGKGVQIAVNLPDAPSATILPAAAVDWAAAALNQPIEAETADPAALSLTVPRGVMPDLLMRVDARLSAMGAAVAEGWLCGLGSGRRAGLVLCVVLREKAAEGAVVSALAETARFAGGERAAFDIAVFAPDDPRLAAARKVGLGFEPADPAARRVEPVAPGTDPSKPPKLR